MRCGAAGEGGANNCLPVRGRFALTFPMLFESREVRPGPRRGLVLNEHGVVEAVPTHWDLLAPGDAALSRRIKQDGPSLTVIELKGRKRFSRGIWAPADRIEALRRELALERQEPAYLRKLEAGRRGREREQAAYAVEFREAVRWYLAFHPAYQAEGRCSPGWWPTMPCRWVAGRSPAPSASPLRRGLRPPPSPGCATRRQGMTRCRLPG